MSSEKYRLLKEENTRLRRKIKTLREEIKQTNQLIDFVVHDLKNPLSVIEMNYEIIRDCIEEDNELRKLASTGELIQGQIKKMKELILELLNISRMEGARLQLNPVSVNPRQYLEEVIQDNTPLVKQNGMRLVLKADSKLPEVSLDKSLMGRVFSNLIGNAVHHSVDSKDIILHAYMKGKKVVFAVEDFGIGIPENKQKKIFEKFGQAGKKGEKKNNHGLGLYFCKLAVKLHGSKIHLKSQKGKGSTFFFSL